MKRLIVLVLVLTMLLCGCAKPQPQLAETASILATTVPVPTTIPWEETELKSSSLGSVKLMNYIEEEIRAELSLSLDPEVYRVDEVSVKYISKEYLEELEYNSQVNIFFGYTLAEVEEMFEGDPFVFTLGDNGQTTVERFVANESTFDRLIRGVAIGGGILLVCVTVVVIATNPGTAAAVGTAVKMFFTLGTTGKNAATASIMADVLCEAAKAIPRAVTAESPEAALETVAIRVNEALIGKVVCGITKP